MNRALSMLGLCARAGKLVSGGGGAFAVLIDASAAKNAVKSITDACAHHQVTLLTAPENELGSAIGKPGRMVAAITDAKLAERVIELSRND